MPVIPEFVSTAPYQDAPPDAKLNPAALAAGDNAIADAMERISGHFAEALGAYQQNRAAATAIAASAGLSMELADKKLAYQKDPDPGTASQRFKADVLDWSKQKLNEISDPMVRAHVASHLSREVASAYSQVAATSLSNGARNQQADIAQGIGSQAKLLAGASDPLAAANAAGAIRQAVAGGLASGVFDHGTAAAVTSRAFRDAIVIKGATDPDAAAAMLNTYTSEMTADDVASTTEHLRNPLIRQMGDRVAGATNGAAGGRPTPISATDLPPEAGQLLPALAGGESPGYNIRYTPRGGAAFDGYAQHPQIREPTKDGRTSDAAGRYQFLSSTYAPLAQKLGLPDFRPPSQDKAAWQLAVDTYAEKRPGRDLATDIRAGGHEAEIATALNKVWPSLPGGSQQNTTLDTWRMRLAAAGPNGGVDGPPLAARISDVRQRVETEVPEWARPEVLRHAETQVTHQYTLDQAGLADQRSDLHREIANLRAGYEQGLTTPEIPEARIRALLKPGDAQATIETLRDTRVAGDLYRAVQWASPDEEQQARLQLAVPGSIRATMPRKDGKIVGAPANMEDPAEDAETRRSRLGQLAKYDELLERKHKALLADPLAYTAAAPEIAAKFKAIDPADPSTQTAAVQASLDLQARLGVPEAQRRVLTNAQVSDIVDKLHRTDPAKADMGLALSGIAKQYGDQWPAALGELVRVGKLSGDYQILASADTPGQAAARADFQRALLFRTQKGGAEQLRKEAPPDAVKAIDAGLDETIDPIRQTTRHSQGGLALLATMRDGIRTLATYYAIQGDSASTALEKAYQGLFGAKYDTSDTMIAPKGQMAEVRRATLQTQQGLTAVDLATPADRGLPGETESARRDALLAAARRGMWLPNRDGSGLILAARFRDGQVSTVLRQDGTPVEIRFDHLPTAAPVSPVPEPSAMVP